MPVTRDLLWTVLAMSATACGPRSVQGSLSVLMDMRYQTVDIVLGSSDVTVRFVRPSNDQGQGEDLVLGVSSRELTMPLTSTTGSGVSWDLAEPLGSGQRGSLSRNVLNDPRQTFPDLDRGDLTFEQIPVAGSSATGHFSVTFVLGTEFGDGRTLYESFSGAVR